MSINSTTSNNLNKHLKNSIASGKWINYARTYPGNSERSKPYR